MPKILFWVSLYFLSVSILLLFFRCTNYYDNPCMVLYRKEIDSFYIVFFSKLKDNGNSVSHLAYSDSVFGAFYRHCLCKSYILEEAKLRDLNFTEVEISKIKNHILPGFNKRIELFNHLNIINIFLTINVGVIVGSLI